MKKLIAPFLLMFVLVGCGTSTPTASSVDSKTVYITKTGSKYHDSGCSYLSKSKIEITLSDAKSRGFSACSKCNP